LTKKERDALAEKKERERLERKIQEEKEARCEAVIEHLDKLIEKKGKFKEVDEDFQENAKRVARDLKNYLKNKHPEIKNLDDFGDFADHILSNTTLINNVMDDPTNTNLYESLMKVIVEIFSS